MQLILNSRLNKTQAVACPRALPAVSMVPRALRLVLAAGAVLAAASGSAWSASTAMQTYRQDRADCMAGRTNEDRATCLREAGAALQRAQRERGRDEDTAQFAQNRLARCDRQPAGDRDECVRRMNDGTITGSVEGGGVLREHRYTVPADGR